jgi:hypothetical protein
MNNIVTQEMVDAEYALLQEYAATLYSPEYAMSFYDSELAAKEKRGNYTLEDKLNTIRNMRQDRYGLRD